VRKVKPAVVSIITYDSEGEPLMTGSGFFVDHCKVVTNLHVIRGATKVEIKMLDGKGALILPPGYSPWILKAISH
jgi:S1-C subfamily serine protease